MAKGHKRRIKTAVDLARKEADKAPLRRFLLVCEGSETEPAYFRALLKYISLPTGRVVIAGKECGTDPLSVVNYAIERTAEDGDFDVVFCIIDSDSHPNLNQASARARQFNSSFDGNFEIILSVPCFEVWLLMHFEKSGSPYIASKGKSACEVVISKLTKKHLNDYKKGSSSNFEQTVSNIDLAVNNSHAIYLACLKNGSFNSSTLVYRSICILCKEAGHQLSSCAKVANQSQI